MNGIILLFVTLISFAARAGNDAGGGGGAVVCRNSTGQIQSARLLDLYEAEVVQKLNLRTSSSQIEEEYFRFLQMKRWIETSNAKPLSQQEKAQALKQLKVMQGYFRLTEYGESVPKTDDFGLTPYLPPSCEIEQLAFFDDAKMMTIVDSEIWNALDPMNQMALYAHEYFYRRFRLVDERTSEVVRKVVGIAFQERPRRMNQDTVPENALACMTHGQGETYFYIYKNPLNKRQTVLSFSQLLGRNTLWPQKVVVDFPIEKEMMRTDSKNGVFVTDKNANYHVRSVLADGPLASYQVGIDFEFEKPFQISLRDPLGKLLKQVTVNGCLPRRLLDFGKLLSLYAHVDPFQSVPPDLFKEALIFYHTHSKTLTNRRFMTVIDYSKHSSHKRFFIMDMIKGEVFSTYVSHGQGSDPLNTGIPDRFGNEPGSRQTSLGYYRTTEDKMSDHGRTLYLDGLSASNSNAGERALVVHGAEYVKDAPVRQGRTWGTFAIPETLTDEVMDRVGVGSLIYAGFAR